MTKSNNEYVPPKVWQWDAESGGKWAGTNRPIAGVTHDKVFNDNNDNNMTNGW